MSSTSAAPGGKTMQPAADGHRVTSVDRFRKVVGTTGGQPRPDAAELTPTRWAAAR
jgi:hypothetical protein